MTEIRKRIDYQDRMDRIVRYIYDHMDDAIDLNQLAEIACLSPYHWHRIYRAMKGETLAATVKRLRLHRAAGYLAYTSMNVEQIAEKSGYPNVQSFTRIFKNSYGLPPAEYRKKGSHTQFLVEQSPVGEHAHEVNVKRFPATQALGMKHHGAYMEIGKTFDALVSWLARHNLLTEKIKLVGLYYDDPDAVEEAQLRSYACVVGIVSTSKIQPPVCTIEIPAGRYAVLRHKGPYADMKAAYRWLLGEWLPQSGREIANVPILEEYLNNPRDTAPTNLLTDICVMLN